MVLDSIVTAWKGLSDQRTESQDLPPRVRVAERLQSDFTVGGLSDEVVCYFVSQAEAPEMFWSIFVALKHMNHPSAVAFIARSAARQDQEAEEAGTTSSASFWSITGHWDSRWTPYPRRLDDGCMNRLRNLWDQEGQEKYLRRHAFSLWLTRGGNENLPLLQGIGPENPLYDLALSERIWLGDQTAAAGSYRKTKSVSISRLRMVSV